jgi:hypothetical protein
LRDDVPLAEAPNLLQTWPQGRFFTEAADLRWERQPDGAWHLTILADTALPAFVAGTIELHPSGPARPFLLWGTRREGAWREDRIPGVGLGYPELWTGPNAAVWIQTYDSPWQPGGPETATVRIVTRYLRFDGNHTPTRLPYHLPDVPARDEE